MSASTPGKTRSPSNVLYRSCIEICRILETLANERGAVFSEIGSGNKFASQILLVDTNNGHFVCSYCANKPLNSKLLKLSSVKLIASYRDAQLVFEAFNPTETQFEGLPAIQFDLPNSLIFHHRREHPRIPILAEASLRCIADEEGFAPFESHICDISHDGLGGIIYDRDINLEPGMVLNACRIIIPNGKAVVVDLEVRHITMVALPDGTLAYRAGLQFIQSPDKITELINFFIQDLDKK